VRSRLAAVEPTAFAFQREGRANNARTGAWVRPHGPSRSLIGQYSLEIGA
jgi:hypothetical protein